MDFKDYYSALGVERTASDDEIKKAYRKLARKYHPDVSTEADAETRMREVNEAYEVLRDAEKRRAYDALADRVARGGRADGEFQPPPDWDAGFEFQRRPGASGPADHAGFSDFFSSLFGAAEHRQARRGQFRARGDDHHAAIEIALEDAINGGERDIQLRSLDIGDDGQPKLVTRTLRVNIPRGVHPGQFIRLAGQGLPGHGGEPAGDLYLEIRIAPHPLYRTDGRDLIMTLPVTPSEAALGAQVDVPLPTGGTAQVTIPPAARPGMRLRLKERGLGGGHLYLVLEIALPPAQDDASRDAYRQLAAATRGFDPRRNLAARGSRGG
ncbi:MAG: DnaJ C-terminal domain-containing protein [Lautropia sp.]